ncbi:MAG: Shedu immune nuclease family protein [Acidimicrobiia bacterium]
MARIEDDQEAKFAMSRRPEQIRISKRFPYEVQDGAAEFQGQAARFAYKVFDASDDVVAENDNGLELVLRETATRQQLKALFFEDSRQIPRVLFQRFNAEGQPIKREKFVLSAYEVRDLQLFLAMIRSPSLELDDDEFGISLTTAAALEMLADDRESARLLKAMGPEAIQEMFRSDVTAPEVIAYARRRAQLERFNELMNDDGAFEAESAALKAEGRRSGNEATWQAFFEANTWIFGTGLAPQFLHAWDPERLEQTVRGASVSGPGKKPDALMRTAGALSALALVEIKSHRTLLIQGKEYRKGVWPPSDELAASIAQCHTTLDTATQALGRTLRQTDDEGYDSDNWALVCRPRSLLVIGSLAQFERDGRPNLEQFESFERFRRSLSDPEVITFDELYQRANLALEMANADMHEPERDTVISVSDWGPDEAPF